MIILELPTVFAANYDDIIESEKMDVHVDTEETIEKTTFFISNNSFMRINPGAKEGRTTLYFNPDDTYSIDADYETVKQIIQSAIK